MPETSQLKHRLALLLLLLILAMAAGLRFYNINWDQGIFAHPDERSTVAFYAPTIRWSEDLSTALDPRASSLNPFWETTRQERRSYTYGHFPLYTLVFVADMLNDLAPLAAAYLPAGWVQFLATSESGQGYAQVGRALMALADLLTVYLLFLIGRRLYGVWGGLLAAALAAFTVLQIQLAHFFAVDPVSTTFTMLALYGAMLMYDRQSGGTAILTGVGIGLAVASKFSALPVAFAPIVAAYLATAHHKTGPDLSAKSAIQVRMLGLALLALLVSVLVFTLTSPFVLLDFENFQRAVLEEQGDMVSGVADFPFTRQYRNTHAYWYFIEQQLRWGMGWPLGLLALAGLGWVAVKAGRGKAQPGEWIILWWIILYFGPTGLFLAKFMRYMVPVVPLFTLFGAGLVSALWQYQSRRVSRPASQPVSQQPANQPTGLQPISALSLPASSPSPHLQKLTKGLALALAIIALSGAVFWSLAFVNGVYGSEHPWVTFARWTYAHVPAGACIAWEHWDDRMPADLPEPGGNPGAHAYFQPQLPMYEEDTQQKYENLRETLQNCDYITLASNRLWRTIPRLPERYPMSSRYYQALFAGELGFEQIYTVETPPQLGPFVFDDQGADESFTVYDHPQPIMFKKTRQLSDAEWDAILGNTWQGAIPGYVGRPTLLMRLRGATHTPAVVAASQTSADKSLLLERPVDQLPVVDDFRWNGAANRSTLIAILCWWLVVMVMGLLTLPLTYLLFNKLPDRGYGLSKSLGLLLIGYFVWLNSSLGLLPNRVTTAIIGIIILMGFGLWAIISRPQLLINFWHEQRPLIFISELIFSLVYLFFVYIRILNPDLWQPWLGGEKMLEIGFLNAIVKSAQMPPYDPFFAGGIINYYYYGLFLVGVLIKLTGIQPGIAFNLAVPTLAALTALNVFSLAGNLALTRSPYTRLKPGAGATSPPPSVNSRPLSLKSLTSGLLAVLFVVFIGNLEGAAQFMRELSNQSGGGFRSVIPGLETLVLALSGLVYVVNGETLAIYNYWDPTRVIPETINEFPYFSFLFADLHPHMIGIPFTILFLSLAYNWLGQPASDPPETAQVFEISRLFQKLRLDPGRYAAALGRWLALPFVLGAIGVINTWDLPTYLGLTLAALLLSRYRRLKDGLNLTQGIRLLIGVGVFAGALLAATYLLYLPFFANYEPPAETGLGLVHTQTPLWQHLKIWGFFLAIIISWLWLSLLYPATRNGVLRAASLVLRRWNVWPHLSQIYKKVVQDESDGYQLALWSAGFGLLSSIGLALVGYSVPAYLLPLVILALILLFRREVAAETTYLSLLAFTGLLILLGVEFFFLRDFLGGGEYYRMNTLFKFFIQVWVIFSLVAAVVLPQIWQWSWRWPLTGQMIWRGSIAFLLLGVLVYPILGTRTRVDDRFPGDQNRPPIGSLDGLAYMTVGNFEWPPGQWVELKYDYEAIRWLQANVPGTPIIAEAKIGYYREGGMRVAAYTGLPSILGGLHQNEQRYAWQVGDRDFIVNEFWATPDPDRTLQLIDQLNISYIYLGQIERVTYGDYIEHKFEQLHKEGALELVFQNEKTKIYQRRT